VTEPRTADDPEELAGLICQARATYLQAQKLLIDAGKIQDWLSSHGFAPEPAITAFGTTMEGQLDSLAPSIRQAETGLAAMVPPAVMEDLLAKAEAAEQGRDREIGNDPAEAIAAAGGILTGPGSLQSKRARLAVAIAAMAWHR
jgi:hypothetical protein